MKKLTYSEIWALFEHHIKEIEDWAECLGFGPVVASAKRLRELNDLAEFG